MKRTIILMMVTLALVTCKKQTVAGPEGPQGPKGEQGASGTTANGSIYGKVKLIDPNSITSTLSLANTTVSITDQTVSAVTDSKGSFTVTNVAPGMLDLSVTSTDGAIYKWQQFPFPGNNKAHLNFTVSKKLTEPVSGRINDTIVNGKKGLYVHSVFTPSVTGSRALVLIIGSTSQVNANDPNSYLHSTTYLGSGANLKISFFVDYDDITSAYMFAAGQQIFATAYPLPAGNYSYWDIYADHEVFYAAGNAISPVYTSTVQ